MFVVNETSGTIAAIADGDSGKECVRFQKASRILIRILILKQLLRNILLRCFES